MFKKYSVEYDPKSGYHEVVAWWSQEAGHGLEGDVIYKHVLDSVCRAYMAIQPEILTIRTRHNGRF